MGSYVVGRGPGSFTGVRIGISTAKGLARGANVPLLGVSTLDACAWTAWKAGVRGKLGILADAMRGEVYPALYVLGDEGPERQFEREHVVKAAVALDEWRQAADWDQVQLTGDGLVRYGKLLGEDEAARCVERGLWWPSGEGLLLAHAAGDGDPARVLPIYTRLSDAEENERKRLGLAESAQSEITASPMSSPVAICKFRPMGAADAEGASAPGGRLLCRHAVLHPGGGGVLFVQLGCLPPQPAPEHPQGAGKAQGVLRGLSHIALPCTLSSAARSALNTGENLLIPRELQNSGWGTAPPSPNTGCSRAWRCPCCTSPLPCFPPLPLCSSPRLPRTGAGPPPGRGSHHGKGSAAGTGFWHVLCRGVFLFWRCLGPGFLSQQRRGSLPAGASPIGSADLFGCGGRQPAKGYGRTV